MITLESSRSVAPLTDLNLPVGPYGTHLVPLIGAVANTMGPVLECGTGLFSTPVLHTMCAATRRRLVSIETDEEWMSRFTTLRTHWHEVTLIESWRGFLASDRREWGAVLVDNNPHEARMEVLAALADRAAILVLHDSNYFAGGFRGWEVYRDQQPVIGWFRYKRHFDPEPGCLPRTTLLSNRVPLDVLDIAA